MTEETKQNKVSTVPYWVSLFKQIASGIGWLLFFLIIVIACNYQGMLEALAKYKQTTQCVAVQPAVKP